MGRAAFGVKETVRLVGCINNQRAQEIRVLGAEGVGGRFSLCDHHLLWTVSSRTRLLGGICEYANT